MLSVEVVHLRTYYIFWTGSNDRCLFTMTFFANESPQQTVSIFGGSSIIYVSLMAVMLRI